MGSRVCYVTHDFSWTIGIDFQWDADSKQKSRHPLLGEN